MAELDLPSYAAIEDALLAYLVENSPVRSRDVYQPLAEQMGISPEHLKATRRDNKTPLWHNRIQWARKSLKDKGLLETSDRGIWRITPAAREAVGGDEDHTPVAQAFSTLEGGRLLRKHMDLERSPELVRKFKENLTTFECVACGFSFEQTYGELGKRFIEAHHIVPLSALDQPRQNSPDDLVALCANCHRMVHRRDVLSVDDLRTAIAAARRDNGR